MRTALLFAAWQAVPSVLIEHVSVDSTGTIHFEDESDDPSPPQAPTETVKIQDTPQPPVDPTTVTGSKTPQPPGFPEFDQLDQYAATMTTTKNKVNANKHVLDLLETYSMLMPTCACTNHEALQEPTSRKTRLCAAGGVDGACKYMPAWKKYGKFGCGQGGIVATDGYDLPCVYMDVLAGVDHPPPPQPTGSQAASELSLKTSCEPGGQLHQKFADADADIVDLQNQMNEKLADWKSWTNLPDVGRWWAPYKLNHAVSGCNPDFTHDPMPVATRHDYTGCFEEVVIFLTTKWSKTRELETQEAVIAAMEHFEVMHDQAGVLRLSDIWQSGENPRKIRECDCPGGWSTGSPTDELSCELRGPHGGTPDNQRYCNAVSALGSQSPGEKVNWSCNHNWRPCVGSQGPSPPPPVGPEPKPSCIGEITIGYNNYVQFKKDAAAWLIDIQDRKERLMGLFLESNLICNIDGFCDQYPEDPECCKDCGDPEPETTTETTTTVPLGLPRCDCRTQQKNYAVCAGRGHPDALKKYGSCTVNVSVSDIWPQEGEIGCQQSMQTNKDRRNRQCEKHATGKMGTVGSTSQGCSSDWHACVYKKNKNERFWRYCPHGNDWCGKYLYDKANWDTLKLAGVYGR